MDLHLAAYFVAVVDHGGITKAARALYISQPSLSQAIRTLERRLGTTLFDRSGRTLELTEDGRKVEAVARGILADVGRAKARVTAVRELDAGRVDVVTSSAFSIDPMVTLVQRFQRRHPHVTVRIHDTPGPLGVLAALRSGAAEVGVVDLTADTATLRTVPIATQELVLALPPDLAEGLPDPVPRGRVAALPLILDVAGRGGTALVGSLLGEGGDPVVVDCAHPTATWDLVARGTGATVLPRAVAEGQLRGVTVRALDPPLIRRVGLVLRSGPASPAAEAFAATATDDGEI
ncbi:transcriptional regulator CynR [Rhodococcus olei]|uniref:Transcriptional regulator CynR n=1 Tax=Rhodococcus olei TaxID=2161675 RepID=A0ABP8P2V8_9NOCA